MFDDRLPLAAGAGRGRTATEFRSMRCLGRITAHSLAVILP